MITPEQRAELRRSAQLLKADGIYSMTASINDVLALLDALDAAIAAVLTLSAAMEDEEIFSQERKLDRMGL